MATLEFEEVSKVFDNGVHAVRDLNLTVVDGEFVVLVGPSGCGKTTALRMLAGLERITAGEIRIGGVRVNDVQSRDRDVAMVFQNYALYPHMSVYDNIGFGLRVRHIPKPQRRARIERAAAILGLSGHLDRKPAQLSGGQRQRVAMGRAIVREPQAFLMDEPLSNLDARLRVQMRTEIARIQHELGVTTVYVTHDQVEAMTMADRVAVLRGGVLQQFDTPQRVYAEPANLFVATFIGSPAMNVVEARLERGDGGIQCRIGAQALPLPVGILTERPALANAIGRTVAAGIRPEAIAVATGGDSLLHGSVVVSEELGSEVIAHIEIEATPVIREEILEEFADEPPTGTAALGMLTPIEYEKVNSQTANVA
jgi:multiple sugar transport system ATP-binding protein